MYKIRRRWSDRIKELEEPLFGGYVFCRLDPLERLPVLTIPGVVRFVSVGRNPAPIEDCEIAAIQSVVSSGFPAEPWPFLRVGQTVRIEDGPLRDLEGLLINIKGSHRLVISVGLLQRSVAVEIDRDWVTPINPSRSAGSGGHLLNTQPS